MSELFLTVVNMSISASWIVLTVLVLRLLLKKAPKWITVALWGIVAVRLICPFAIESAISLIPSAETISSDIMTDTTPEINTGIPAINSTINPVISNSFSPEPATSANPLQILIPVLAVTWIVGIAAMLIYTGVSYWRIKGKISTAVLYRNNVFQSENVVSPFVLGIVKPKIYLPFKMNDKDTEYVIAHEKAHISRKDYVWKPLGFLLLALHWFNPVMWLGYVLLCRDIELACDEKVVKEMNTEQRADYSQALLTCSVNRRMIAACPLAFGEVGVKERVKTVLNYKKPAFWIIVVAVVAGAAVAVCFLTNPMSTEDNHNANTISFDGKTLNKSDLSQETIEWLEWYNGLSETEQMATDLIPHELLDIIYAEQTGGGDVPVENINSVDGEPLETSIDTADFDIDGDGNEEHCELHYGPTSGLFTFTISAYENGKLEYFNIFNSPYLTLSFETNADGKTMLVGRDEDYTRYMGIDVLNENIIISCDEQDISYWGGQGINSQFAPKGKYTNLL